MCGHITNVPLFISVTRAMMATLDYPTTGQEMLQWAYILTSYFTLLAYLTAILPLLTHKKSPNKLRSEEGFKQ